MPGFVGLAVAAWPATAGRDDGPVTSGSDEKQPPPSDLDTNAAAGTRRRPYTGAARCSLWRCRRGFLTAGRQQQPPICTATVSGALPVTAYGVTKANVVCKNHADIN